MKAIPEGVHLTLQYQYRKCGSKVCRCTKEGNPGHGKYWYAFWRDKETHKVRSVYVGKELPPELQAQATKQGV